jgi:hypothetical protein
MVSANITSPTRWDALEAGSATKMPSALALWPVVGSASERNVALTLVVSVRFVDQVTRVVTGAGMTIPCAPVGRRRPARKRTAATRRAMLISRAWWRRRSCSSSRCIESPF